MVRKINKKDLHMHSFTAHMNDYTVKMCIMLNCVIPLQRL